MKKIALILLIGLLGLASCAKKEEEEDDSLRGSSSSDEDLMACVSYVDGTTYSYFHCIDYSDEENDFDADQVESICDQTTNGELVSSCDSVYTYESGEYTSDGVCAYTNSGYNYTHRIYYITEGDGPSEGAICTSVSGTYTAD